MSRTVVILSNTLALVSVFLRLYLTQDVLEVFGIIFSLLGNLAVVKSTISLGDIYFGLYLFYLGVDTLGINLNKPAGSLYISWWVLVEAGFRWPRVSSSFGEALLKFQHLFDWLLILVLMFFPDMVYTFELPLGPHLFFPEADFPILIRPGSLQIDPADLIRSFLFINIF